MIIDNNRRAKENDRKAANEAGTQLTYGEIDPRGVMMMAKNLSFKDGSRCQRHSENLQLL